LLIGHSGHYTRSVDEINGMFRLPLTVRQCIKIGMKLKKSPEWMEAVGHRLKQSREVLGKSQAEICRALKIGTARWNNYEKGKRPLDLDVALDLCRHFNLSLDWLYRGLPGTLPYTLAVKIGGYEREETKFKN